MKTIEQLIQEFDNLETNTVRDFNELFPNSPIKLVVKHFLQVQIGEPIKCMGLDSQVRELTVGAEVTQHRLSTHAPMTSDLRYLKDDEDKKAEELYKVSYTQDKGFE